MSIADVDPISGMDYLNLQIVVIGGFTVVVDGCGVVVDGCVVVIV